MEQYKNTSWQIYKEAITRRNLMFLLNVTLWSFVLYFSLYEDGIDALLSYVSVPLTLFAFRGMGNVGDSFAYFLNLSSKVLILAGIGLVIFSKFWNTAFYSICLAILIQKVIYEIELQARNVNPVSREQASSEVAKTDTSDEFKQLIPGESLTLTKVTQDVHARENEIKELNMDKFYESIGFDALTDMELQSTREKNEQIEEILNSHEKWNKQNPDASEISSAIDEIFSTEVFQRYFHEQSGESENMFNDKNFKNLSDTSEEQDKSTLNFSENLLQSEMACALKLKVLNLKELSLRERAKIKSKLDLDVSNNELNENEVTDMDTSEKSGTLNVETLKVSFPEDNTQKLDVISNDVEFLDGPESKFEKELLNERTNISSDAYSGRPRDFIQNNERSSCSYKNMYQQNKNEINQKHLETTSNYVEFETEPENKLKKELFQICVNTSLDVFKEKDLTSSCNCNKSCQQNLIKHEADLKTLHRFKMNVDTPLLNKSTCLDMDLSNQESVGKDNSKHSAIDQEKCLINESSLQEHSFETNPEIESKANYPELKCTSIETTDTQPEKETCDYELKRISHNYVNPDILEKYIEVLPEPENCLELKGFSSSIISDFRDDSSKSNELANDAEDRNLTKESVNKSSGDEGATLIPCVSNVEDVVNIIDFGVVNTIDLGFIYDLNFNDPCATN